MLSEKLAQIQYSFFARNITHNQYATNRRIDARRALFIEEPTTYDPLANVTDEVKDFLPYANIEITPNGQILEAEQRFSPFGYELSSLGSECIVTQHFNTEKGSEKTNALKVEFLYVPSYEPIDTTDKPPFYLVATHTLEDHKVKNEVRIFIKNK